MFDIILISFDSSPNKYYFSPNKLKLKKNDRVVVEKENGTDIGTCKTNIIKEKRENLAFPLKYVKRIATEEDIARDKKNKEESAKALIYAKKLSKQLHLKMNFIASNYTLDKSQLYLSYVSEERIDFRELAKKLAQRYRTRIELRQVGVRDKAKIMGGIGPCGLLLCCNSFLTDFNSVSINMAKNQFLALNPNKINGACGRLLCCLNYEDEVYRELKQNFPKIGSKIKTSKGEGKVISINLFHQTYQVEIDKNNIIEETVKESYDTIK
ncbi:MAG: signal peptidase II [Bacilli bacterium]|nr:signal peptidase II [Bacilli bacterium]